MAHKAVHVKTSRFPRAIQSTCTSHTDDSERIMIRDSLASITLVDEMSHPGTSNASRGSGTPLSPTFGGGGESKLPGVTPPAPPADLTAGLSTVNNIARSAFDPDLVRGR